jgi:cyclase
VNLEGLRNLGSPSYFASVYYNGGIDEIYYQDVVASLYERNSIDRIIETTAKNIFVAICVGGGLRNNYDIDRALRKGADKICLNSGAVRHPHIIKKAASVYGSSTISVNIETAKVNDKYEVFIDSGRERTGIKLEEWLKKVQDYGAGEIILTSIAHEGRQKGFDIDLYKGIKKYVSVPLIAHGGAGTINHIVELFKNCDVDGVALAGLLHYSYMKKYIRDLDDGAKDFINNRFEKLKEKVTIKEIKKILKKNGIKVRL